MGSATVFDKSERTDGTLSCSDLSFDPEPNFVLPERQKKAPRKGKPFNGPAGELRLSEAVAWVGGFRMAGRAVKAEKLDTRTAVLEVAKKVLRQSGYSKLSTRDVAAAAGAPVSQIHYHFGSKQGMVLALFEYLNAQLLDRQGLLFDDVTLKVSEQWDRACDYLDEDIASGYVRILQELIAASWADPAIGKVVRAGLLGWSDAVSKSRVASRARTQRSWSVFVGRVGCPDRQRVSRRREYVSARSRKERRPRAPVPAAHR